MTPDDKSSDLDSEDFDTTKKVDPQPVADDETMTTELVKVDPGTSVPFSLPHVSELDEVTPRDARKDPGKLVTLPAYSQIVSPPESAKTEMKTTIPSARGGGSGSYPAPARSPSDPTLPLFPDSREPVPPPPGGHPLRDSAKLQRKRRRKRRVLGLPLGCLWVFAGLCLTFCGGLTLLTIGAAMIFLPQVEAEWTARIATVDNYRGFESTFIYDRYGNELYEAFGEGRRVHVSFDHIPSALILATIAIEDDTFFDNIGIDVAATTIAALSYVGAAAGENTPGGSTITQQLVRNVFFDFEKRAQRTIARKAEEILLAIVLTQSRSKEEILEMYFNEIYYGNLAYGVQTAAQTFFGKDVDQLSLGEAAMLAGLPQAPANLDPLNPDPAVQAAVDERWRQVLGEMVEEGFITQDQVREALQQGLSFAPPKVSLTAPHFTVYAQGELERLMLSLGYGPDEITGGGLRVYTTLDQSVNRFGTARGRQSSRAAPS